MESFLHVEMTLRKMTLSDSSGAIEKQSLYLIWGCAAQLWLICSKFYSRNVTGHLDQYRQLWVSIAVTGTHWLTAACWNDVCITKDGCKVVWWINFDTDCPRRQLLFSGKMPPIYDGSSWAYARLRREIFGRKIIWSLEGFHRWSSDQQTEIIWSCQQRHHFRRGEFCADTQCWHWWEGKGSAKTFVSIKSEVMQPRLHRTDCKIWLFSLMCIWSCIK